MPYAREVRAMYFWCYGRMTMGHTRFAFVFHHWSRIRFTPCQTTVDGESAFRRVVSHGLQRSPNFFLLHQTLLFKRGCNGRVVFIEIDTKKPKLGWLGLEGCGLQIILYYWHVAIVVV